MRINALVKVLLALPLTISLAACGLDPYHLEDPSTLVGLGPKVSDVVRSLRCEIVTFIVENKVRSQIVSDLGSSLKAAAVGNQATLNAISTALTTYPFIDIDSTEYASLVVDMKNVDTANLTLGYDWKKPSTILKPTTRNLDQLVGSGEYADYHVGPSYADTRTFEFLEQIAIAQSADLGPTKYLSQGKEVKISPRSAAAISNAYYPHTDEDQNFYCYKSLGGSNSKTPVDVAGDIENLMNNDPDWVKFKQFDRIYVGGETITLARWLQNMASEMAFNQKTVFPTAENILNGQFEYTFTLDVRPGLDAKYTLVAALTNPLVPEVSGSVDHSSTFSVYLNTPYAFAALGAKNGTSCNTSEKNALKINLNCKKPVDTTGAKTPS